MKKIVTIMMAACMAVILAHAAAAETAQEWIEKGMYYERQAVYDEAIKAYTEAIDLDGQNAEAYFRRGMANALLKPSNSTEAILDFTRVIDLEPEYADAYYQRGLLNAYLINNEQAIADMRTAMGLGHEGARFWLNPQQTVSVEELAFVDLASYLSSRQEPVIHFDYDRSELKEEYYPLLSEVGSVLKQQLPGATIILMGHTDSSGTETYNDGLSVRRAETVKANLIDGHGISAGRIVMRGFGETVPVASNDTEEGRALNRRVEIVAAIRR